MKSLRLLLFVCIVVLALCAPAAAQTPTGGIEGVVRDPRGAVVPTPGSRSRRLRPRESLQ